MSKIDFQSLAESVPKWYHFPVYQSIWFGGKEIVHGGRDNMAKRMSLIRKEDIKDKIVVDIGCNLGAATIWAIENGASLAIGIDVIKEGIEVANKIAGDLKINCVFKIGDFSKKQPKYGDTAFCFACSDDITKEDDDKRKILLDNLLEYDVVYWETHLKNTFRNWNIPEIIKNAFCCEYLGETGDGGYFIRDMYRLSKK